MLNILWYLERALANDGYRVCMTPLEKDLEVKIMEDESDRLFKPVTLYHAIVKSDGTVVVFKDHMVSVPR